MSKGRKASCKHIEKDFEEYFYKPQSIPMLDLKIVSLAKEEMEAMRLVDTLHLSQAEAAEKMNTSSSTLQRIIEKAREKMVSAIIEGNALKIEGGNYEIKGE